MSFGYISGIHTMAIPMNSDIWNEFRETRNLRGVHTSGLGNNPRLLDYVVKQRLNNTDQVADWFNNNEDYLQLKDDIMSYMRSNGDYPEDPNGRLSAIIEEFSEQRGGHIIDHIHHCPHCHECHYCK